MPGSGKTTTAQALARHFEVPYLHSSHIVRASCAGDWIERGDLAPEPCATLAIEAALEDNHEWVLDGFPRSEHQLKSIGHESIVFLDISTKGALRRAIKRGRATPEIEEHRIKDQSRSLAPVRTMAAVVVPVTFRTPEQVTAAVIRWYEHNIHPSELGSMAK